MERWERQEGETPKAFEAFTRYRDLQPSMRSIARAGRDALGDAFTPSRRRHWERWSAGHAWVARADAWDAERDRVKREEDLEQVRAMQQRHQAVAVDLLALVAESAKRMHAEMQENKSQRLPSNLLASITTAATTLERLTMGEPDTITRELASGVEFVVTWGHEEPRDDEATTPTSPGKSELPSSEPQERQAERVEIVGEGVHRIGPMGMGVDRDTYLNPDGSVKAR